MLSKKNIFLLLFLATVSLAGVNFDYSDDYLLVSDNDVLDMDTSDFTISAWVKSGAVTADAVIFRKIGTGNVGYVVAIYSSGEIGVLIRDADSYTSSTADGTQIEDGAWHHIAVAFDRSGNMTRYLDGSTDGTADDITGEAASIDNDGDLMIGGKSDGTLTFNGQLTELALWETLLTADEIALLASARMKRLPLAVQSSSLKFYLPMDDEVDGSSCDGDNFIDWSWNGNNATGDDGADNSGLTAKAEEVLTYPK